MTTAQLKAWRKSKEYTTDEMADYFGISDRKYRDIEKGNKEVPAMMNLIYEGHKTIAGLKREIKTVQQAINLSNKSEAYLMRLKSICEEQIAERETNKASWAFYASDYNLNEEDEKMIKLINEELEARR